MITLNTRPINHCLICGTQTFDATGLCEVCLTRMNEVLTRDAEGTFGRPKVNLSTMEWSLKTSNLNCMLMMSHDPSKLPSDWDSYYHGTPQECIDYIDDIILDAKVRLASKAIITRRKTKEASDKLVEHERYLNEDISYFFDCECKYCGAPMGSELYQVNRKTFEENTYTYSNEPNNTSWDEMDRDCPDGEVRIKPSYSCCCNCVSYEF